MGSSIPGDEVDKQSCYNGPVKGLLLLFDGHGIVHRAFHAFERSPERLTTKSGEVVAAV